MELFSKIRPLILIAILYIATAFPSILFAQCPQNNFTVTGFQLRDANGNLFSVTDNYVLGQPVTGELWVNFGGSTTNGYNMLMYYDVFVNGTRTQDDAYNCLFSGVQVVQNVWVKVRNFTWNWGDVIEIRDIFMYWETGTAKANTTCTVSTKSNINSQCYGNPSGFTAAVPLFPKFDFASNGICNTTIQFTSQTIGGTPPFNYTYSWDFNNDGVMDSNLANPVYNFPSSGTYPIRLTVNDGTSITMITKDIFIDPNFGIQVSIFPTKINDNSGIIYVQSVTGGTPPYSYYWTGPNGFTSTNRDIFNLAEGLYRLTVTDANGCTQTVEYVMDIASVLQIEWKSLEVKEMGSKIAVNWELNSEKEGSRYEIERSFKDAFNFSKIGELASSRSSQAPVNYTFSDETFPVFETILYYRVVLHQEQSISYSPVRMIQRNGANPLKGNWAAYPNPSRDGRIQLKLISENLNSGEKVQVQAINGGSFFKTVELTMGHDGVLSVDQVIGSLPPGLTLLRVQWRNQSETIKVIRSD